MEDAAGWQQLSVSFIEMGVTIGWIPTITIYWSCSLKYWLSISGNKLETNHATIATRRQNI
jgi:hypothetical protein